MTKVTDLIERLRYTASILEANKHKFTVPDHIPAKAVSVREAADRLEALSSECEALHDWLLETQMLAYKWMEAHDKLHSGKPYTFPKPADLPEALAKCEALREALQKISDAPPEQTRAALRILARTTLQKINGGGNADVRNS